MSYRESFNKAELEEIVSFYRRYYQDELAKLAQEFPKDSNSLWIDYHDVFRFNSEEHSDLADMLLDEPEDTRRLFEEALSECELPIDVDLSDATVRFYNVSQERKIDELRDGDVDKLRSLSGQISKASAVRPVVKVAGFICQRCGNKMRVPIDNEMQEPHECSACERQGPFEFDYQTSEVENHQLVRIEQPPEEATNSNQHGNEIDAHIEGDLVGQAEAGARADIPGVLRANRNGDDPTLEFQFDAWAIENKEDDYSNLQLDEYRDELYTLIAEENPFVLLAESIAPSIVGADEIDIETPWGETYGKYWWIRLATGIANLFGSWRRQKPDGTYHRGNSHTLIIGDPSTGKSSIMGAIETIAPRSASESGKNASGPGLTAAAVKDDFGQSTWSLKAGALVKAHNGVACIDEIDKMQKDGLSRLHSALEKQRLEINKAGIDATLKCETSLLAAGNPENSRFTKYDMDHEQIEIVGSLMDRFDLVFTLKDKPEVGKDRKVADQVIDQVAESGLAAKNIIDETEQTAGDTAVSIEKMQNWVALARKEIEPVWTDPSVKDRLKEFYVDIRAENEDADDDDAPVPASVRTLDGLLRLSEASARMRLSEEVQTIDAEMAIALVKVSLQDVGYDPETGKMDVDWMEGRTSQSQRDRVTKILGVVESLQGEEGAPADDVIQAVEKAGHENVRKDIDQLMGKGELYEPRTGRLRTT